MNTLFINFKNSQSCYPYGLVLNLADKINLRGSGKYVALSNLSIYYTPKITKKNIKKVSLSYQDKRGMKNLNYLMDYFEYIIEKYEAFTGNFPIQICTKN